MIEAIVENTTSFFAIRSGDPNAGVRPETVTSTLLICCLKSNFSRCLLLTPVDADSQSVPLNIRPECKMVCLLSITCLRLDPSDFVRRVSVFHPQSIPW